MSDQGEKVKLFESDDEAVESYHDDFKIRPQYEGQYGQQLLDLNTQLSKRFKLDERFAEDFQCGNTETGDEKLLSEECEERARNIKILETILGHEVSTKAPDKSFLNRKRQIRFDPDDENASKFIKKQEITSEKTKKSKKKKKVIEEEPESSIPISAERYIEVCPDLKEILNTASPFSFSQKFNFDHKELENSVQNEVSVNNNNVTEEKTAPYSEKKNRSERNIAENLSTERFSPRTENFIPKLKGDSFFITKHDQRLKEGIEFFKRPKPLDEIRIEWQKRREYVLELFRRKRRSSQQTRKTKVQSMQIKNSIRKKQFKN